MSDTNRISDIIPNLSLFLYSFCVLFLQMGLLTIFSPLIETDSAAWSYCYKGFWLISIATTVWALVSMRSLFAITWPILIFLGGCFLLFSTFHYSAFSKNLLISTIIISVFVVLVSAAGIERCLRFSAQLVTFSAFFILIDMQFMYGLSNSAGRAAGLFINPNIAAGALLVAAIASFSSVSEKFKISFLILVVAAIISTLSRTTIATLCVVAAIYSLYMLKPDRFSGSVRTVKAGITYAVLTCIVVSALIVSASILNPRLTVALSSVNLEINLSHLGDNTEATPIGSHTLENSVKDSEGAQADDNVSSDARIGKVERDSSADARLLLLKRSFAAFMEAPLLGIGIERSYQLRPHNTYLLFAAAYGVVGLLIPLALVAFFLMQRDPDSFAMGAALGCVMFFSHDVLLTPAYTIPVALAIASTLKWDNGDLRNPSENSSHFALLVAICFVAWMNFSIASNAHRIVREVVDVASLTKINSCLYYFESPFLSESRFYTLDRSSAYDRQAISKIEMFENGNNLKARASEKGMSSAGCGGDFEITKLWGIAFSASDGSSPVNNGRIYEIQFPIEGKRLLTILLVMLLVWLYLARAAERRKSTLTPSMV